MSMTRKRYTEPQIVFALQQAEAGTPVGQLCRESWVHEVPLCARRRASPKEETMAGIHFFDDFALDSRIQPERTYVEPECITPEPYQGEGGFVGGPSIQWCPELGCYRLWHSIISDSAAHQHTVGLAESQDCASWEFTGHTYSGAGTMHGAMVYRDPHETDPDRLYKMAGSTARLGAKPGQEDSSIVVTSPDGVNWDDAGLTRCWGKHRSDTSNCLFYNPVRECYQILHRAAFIDRRVASTWSTDLVNWSEPELIVHPDPLDPPCCQLYAMTAFYSDGVFIGFLLIHETDMLDPVPNKMGGRLITELVYSYDGFHWNRTHHRIIPYPRYPAFGAGSMAIQGITEDFNPYHGLGIQKGYRSPSVVELHR